MRWQRSSAASREMKAGFHKGRKPWVTLIVARQLNLVFTKITRPALSTASSCTSMSPVVWTKVPLEVTEVPAPATSLALDLARSCAGTTPALLLEVDHPMSQEARAAIALAIGLVDRLTDEASVEGSGQGDEGWAMLGASVTESDLRVLATFQSETPSWDPAGHALAVTFGT